MKQKITDGKSFKAQTVRFYLVKLSAEAFPSASYITGAPTVNKTSPAGEMNTMLPFQRVSPSAQSGSAALGGKDLIAYFCVKINNSFFAALGKNECYFRAYNRHSVFTNINFNKFDIGTFPVFIF